ncbi:MAG: DMT family transporter [Anaerolineae bacterium]
MLNQMQAVNPPLVKAALTRRIPSTGAAFTVMLIATAFWGAGTVLSKASLDTFPPMTLIAVSLGASCLSLWMALLITGGYKALRWRDARFGLPGILDPGMSYLIGTLGLSLTSANNTAFISATEPVLVFLLAWLILRERIKRNMMWLIGLVILGTVLISSAEVGPDQAVGHIGGDTLVLVATLCSALYTILTRNSLSKLSPLAVAALQQSFGLVFVLALVPIELAEHSTALAQLTLSDWLFACFIGVTQFATAFWLYLIALQRISATQASLMLTATPLFGIGLSVLILGESLVMMQIIGGGLILAAILRIRLSAE